VLDNMHIQDGVIMWNVIFTRLVEDWEMEMILSFFERLYSFQVRHEEDRLIWSPSKRGQFEVKLFYKVLNSQAGHLFPWKSIWCVKALWRVAFLCGQQPWGKFSCMIICVKVI
jgi:hypothetical protein